MREVLNDARARRCIAVDLELLLPDGENGGSWVMTADLVHELSRLLPHWSFVLLTSEDGHAEAARLDAANVRRVCVDRLKPSTVRRSWLETFRAHLPLVGRPAHTTAEPQLEPGLDLLRTLGADLLFCPFGQFRLPAYQDPRIPTVSVVYDLQFLAYPDFFSEDQRVWRERAYVSVCDRSDGLACISETTRGSVLETATIEPERVHTIYIRTRVPGDSGAVGVQMSDVLADLRLRPNGYFVYPANLWRHKNHEALIAAVYTLQQRDSGSAVKVVCTGAGLDRLQELRNLAFERGVADAVLFPGYLPRADLDALLQRCRGLVFPSLYEGFGIPLLEMMHLGKPIACSNVTSLPEVGGDAVLTFDPRQPADIANAMQRLNDDSELTAQLVERGYRRAAEFGDPERMALEYLALFLEVLEEGARQQLRLFGVYGDGWTGDRVLAMLGPGTSEGELELAFTLPAWAPTACIELVVRSSSASRATRVAVPVGTSTTLRVPVNATTRCVEVGLHPLFVPSADGHSQDTRALGAMCDSARLITPDGEVELPMAALR